MKQIDDQWKLEVTFRDRGQLVTRCAPTWYHAPRLGGFMPRQVDAKGQAFLQECLAAADVTTDRHGETCKIVSFNLFCNGDSTSPVLPAGHSRRRRTNDQG